MESKGRILVEEAYAKARMIQSEAWHGVLPRRITPSDVDLAITMDGIADINNIIFDNNATGKQLWVEFATTTASWDTLKATSRGQWLVYRNFVARHPDQMAALCLVKPQPDKPICSRSDVLKFSLMLHQDGDVKTTRIFDGKNWTAAVKNLLGFPT